MLLLVCRVQVEQGRNLLAFFPFEVLIYSMLHTVDPLFESRVPIIFYSVVSAAHELLGDQTPLLVALVSQDE